jgi:hypothetical protein
MGSGMGVNRSSSLMNANLPALEQLPSTCRVEFESKGGGNLPPPLYGFRQLRVTSAHIREIALGIHGIGQRRNHVVNDKPPLVVVDDVADFLPLKQGNMAFGVWRGFSHWLFSLFVGEDQR